LDLVNTSALAAGWLVSQIAPPAQALTAIVKGSFRLIPGAAAILADEQRPLTGEEPEAGDPARPPAYPSDFAPHKPRTDILLTGRCHAPDGRPVTSLMTGLRVGGLTRMLRMTGDRYWLDERRATDPQPFTTMPLSWTRAFGGAGCERNPFGQGFAVIQYPNGAQARPLPNLEDPRFPVRTAAEVVEPAGFGPIPETWPQRTTLFGRLDATYLQTRWPWYPADLDWGFFNCAPPDQQVAGYLRGDEEVAAEHLHPAHPHLLARLPGLRPRALLVERVRARERLREFALALDTVWLDLEQAALVLVWRGHLEVRTPDLLECLHLFVCAESMADPPATLEQLGWRLDEARAAAAVADEEFDPEYEDEETDTAADAGSEEAGEAAGGPPEGGGGTAPPQAAAGAEPEAAAEPLVDPADAGPLTLAQVQALLGAGRPLAGCDLSRLDLSGLDLSGQDLREAVFEGCALIGTNLTGANLAGAVLTRANLREARCVRADLRETDLTGVWLTEADLTEADLTGADLTGVRACKARLPRARAADAVLCLADLADADLQGADLTAADLCDTRLHRTDLRGANLTDAALENAWGRGLKAAGALMHKLRAAGVTLLGADLRQIQAAESVWEGARLGGTDFSHAVLDGAEFSGAWLGGATFDAAELKGARFNEAGLSGARMVRCNLLDASLAAADLSGADLTESNLYGATLMDALTSGARFTRANLRAIKIRGTFP
jgi:uncharacterized protein YjbI with pentapeptide repeats